MCSIRKNILKKTKSSSSATSGHHGGKQNLSSEEFTDLFLLISEITCKCLYVAAVLQYQL